MCARSARGPTRRTTASITSTASATSATCTGRRRCCGARRRCFVDEIRQIPDPSYISAHKQGALMLRTRSILLAGIVAVALSLAGCFETALNLGKADNAKVDTAFVGDWSVTA